MNKAQEQAVQQLRAKIKIGEELKKHYTSWYGKEVKEIGEKISEEIEEEEDGDR